MGGRGNKVLYFRPITFEILIRHPSGDVEEAVGYKSPESGERSGLKSRLVGELRITWRSVSSGDSQAPPLSDSLGPAWVEFAPLISSPDGSVKSHTLPFDFLWLTLIH